MMTPIEILLTISSVITALGVILGAVWTIHKVLNKPQEDREDMKKYQQENDKRMDKVESELKEIKENQHLEAKCLLAILEVLSENGNAKVKDAHTELSEHLLEKAF